MLKSNYHLIFPHINLLHRQSNIKTHIAFVEFGKAFDRFNRYTLLDILAADNIPDKIIHTIHSIYSNNKISVKLTPTHPSGNQLTKE